MVEGKGQPPRIRVKPRAATETAGSCRNCDQTTRSYCQVCKATLCHDCMIDHTHLIDRGYITADDY